MIDIGDKDIIKRECTAEGRIILRERTIEAIKRKNVKKGDVFEVAKTAIMNAVKSTPDIIPHCHSIPIEMVDVLFSFEKDSLICRCTVSTHSKTGVEMEALCGVMIGLLTVWDMVKYLEKDENGQYPYTSINEIKVLKKVKEHKVLSEKVDGIKWAFITVSDSRTEKDDISYFVASKILNEKNLEITFYSIVPNDKKKIMKCIHDALDVSDVVITSGGTGIGKKDMTIYAAEEIADKEIPGFGELFRMLSYKDVGVSAMLSKACAWKIKDKVLFCLPGSPDAVNLALKKIILPEIKHILWELRR